MFGLPLPTVVIIVAIAGLALSMIPWQKLAELKASIPEIPDNSKPDVDPSAKYLEAQKKLLEIRVICKDCPEATAAIDAAIKATVAMVVKPSSLSSLSHPYTFADISKAPVGGVIGTAQVVKGEPLPPRTVDVEVGQ